MEELPASSMKRTSTRKPVVAHSHRPEEIRAGLLAGVDCFEHTGLAAAPEYPAESSR